MSRNSLAEAQPSSYPRTSDASPRLRLSTGAGTQREIRVAGDDCVEAESAAREFRGGKRRQTYVSHRTTIAEVVAGQGVVGAELCSQLERYRRRCTCPSAAVGLISGIAAAVKSRFPGLPDRGLLSGERSKVMFESLAAGRVLDLPSKETLSDGTAGGVERDSITFDLCRDLDRRVCGSYPEGGHPQLPVAVCCSPRNADRGSRCRCHFRSPAWRDRVKAFAARTWLLFCVAAISLRAGLPRYSNKNKSDELGHRVSASRCRSIELEEIKKTARKDRHRSQRSKKASSRIPAVRQTFPPVGELQARERAKSTSNTARSTGSPLLRHQDRVRLLRQSRISDYPAVTAVCWLSVRTQGQLKCILLDEGHLTDVRTAIAGAIAAKYLAPRKSLAYRDRRYR